MNRDARRAQKRRTKRKAEKRDTVERTGLGGFIDSLMPPGPIGVAQLEEISRAQGTNHARKHAPGCGGLLACVPDCETDAQLRKRLQERYG